MADSVVDQVPRLLSLIVGLAMLSGCQSKQSTALSPDAACKRDIETMGKEIMDFANDSKISRSWPGYITVIRIPKETLSCPLGARYWYNHEIAGSPVSQTSNLSQVVLFCEADSSDQPVFPTMAR